MAINNESQALEMINAWKEKSLKVQLALLREAIEGQELSQMYYEQKGNEKGVTRTENILSILRQRKTDLNREMADC